MDWNRLRELREIFIGERSEPGDYWDSWETLDHYDRTFAQRIGWKWDYVLRELAQVGWTPESGAPVCDWGCGSGIAGRCFFNAFDSNGDGEIYFSDRSRMAEDFSIMRLRDIYDEIQIGRGVPEEKSFILISHVGTEISPEELEGIIEMIRTRASGFIWVEPGAYATGRLLSKVHDDMLGEFHPWAPCTTRESCPVLSGERWDDWCHQFAPPPREIFQDSFWSHFSKEMNVDLRSLPVSFLCMDRRPAPDQIDYARMIGRPKIQKFQATMHACHKGCYKNLRIPKRHLPQLFKYFKKGKIDGRIHIEESGEEVTHFTLPGDPDPM